MARMWLQPIAMDSPGAVKCFQRQESEHSPFTPHPLRDIARSQMILFKWGFAPHRPLTSPSLPLESGAVRHDRNHFRGDKAMNRQFHIIIRSLT